MDIADKILSRVRVGAAVDAADVLWCVRSGCLKAETAMDVLGRALGDIQDPGVRNALISKAERAGHDVSSLGGR